MNFIYKNILGISGLYGLGLLVKKNIRWYFVHAVVNLGVVLLTTPDIIHTLTNTNCLNYIPQPWISNIASTSENLNIILTSLHLYHLIAFNARFEDYVHHITGIITYNICIRFIEGSYPGSLLFFMNGLPGFIDYTNLILVKKNIMDKITEKKINTYLNTYIRGPGSVLILGMVFKEYQQFNPVLYLPFFSILFNVQYYTRSVCINYGENIDKMVDNTN